MAGNFPRPPGFEDYNDDDISPDDLAELHSFLGAAATVEKPAEQAAKPWELLSDGRSHRGRGRPGGQGLVGEQGSTVVVSAPKEDGTVQQAPPDLLEKDSTFEDFGFSEALLRGVSDAGFVQPSKIQAGALPYICKNSPNGPLNMIGQAQNGSGKTATFSLALLSQLDVENYTPQALVINPTRELARQNAAVISQLGQYLPVVTQLVSQGENVPRHPKCHVLVGTPGKLEDLAKKNIIQLSNIKVFVLDEADTMLDQDNQMGPQVKRIRSFLPTGVQVLFFSATYPDEVRQFAEDQAPGAMSIKVKKTELTLSSVAQMYMKCADGGWDKFNKLSALYASMTVGQSVVFVNQRRTAFQLAKWMQDAGFSVSLICGTQLTGPDRMDPKLRDTVMDEFRSGKTKVLIATDVLSRGIDVPQVTLVVNYELPMSYAHSGVEMETYLHRVGRTGRFGLHGIAVNLICDSETDKIHEICSFFDCTITEMSEDFEQLEERLKSLR